MSSGNKSLVYNTRERGLSVDQNRAQRFAAAAMGDVAHYLHDGIGPDASMDFGNGPSDFPETSDQLPVGGLIYGGLMVVVPLGGTELIVTPGACRILDVDGTTGSPVTDAASTDDSTTKLLVDKVGVLSGSGTLALVPNATGAIRVDIVEIRRLPNQILESDNRDLFNSTTGAGAPALVTKVQQDGIDYRIRTGALAAGALVLEKGWVPIAVYGMPNGAVSFDDCTFYDVRPLLRDRHAQGRVHRQYSGGEQDIDLMVDPLTVTTERRLYGVGSGWFNGYRAFGTLQGKVDVQYIDLMDGDYHSPSIALTPNKLLYIWALFPGGLPRWVRYLTTALAPYGGRVPANSYGITCLSDIPPNDENGIDPVSSIAVPPWSGLHASLVVDTAKTWVSFAADTTSNPCVFYKRKNRVTFGSFGTITPASAAPSIVQTAGVSDANSDAFQFTAVQIPRTAKRLLMNVLAQFNPTTTPCSFSIEPTPFISSINQSLGTVLTDLNFFQGLARGVQGLVGVTGAGTFVQRVMEVELQPNPNNRFNNASNTTIVTVGWDAQPYDPSVNPIVRSNAQAAIFGWEE